MYTSCMAASMLKAALLHMTYSYSCLHGNMLQGSAACCIHSYDLRQPEAQQQVKRMQLWVQAGMQTASTSESSQAPIPWAGMQR